jgi:ubiquinone/menaquinone biosynthesis C-methylase UbiE/acyl carrier protein
LSHQGSYRAETFAVGLDHEIRRLNAQVDLFWRAERATLRRAGLRDGMDVLDCGCGPGRLIELLTTEFESLCVTGLDVDPTLVTAAKDYLARAGLDHFDVVQGSAEHPNLPPERFDFIVVRLVLEHVVDPLAALRELKKLLRPGGKIAVISNDFAFHLRTWPEVRELDDLYDAYIASRRADEGDPCIGRRVPDLLRQAGLRLAGFEVEVAHNHLEGDRAFLLAEGAGIPAQLVQSGYLDEGVFQRLVTSWKAMLEHPDHTIMRPLFIAVGENSDEDDVTPGATLTAVPAPSAAYHLEHVAPTTDLERDITQIWADVIGLERVGVNQNFFDLGGTSLMLEHVQVRLETLLGSELPLTLLFQYPTVEALAASLDEAPPAEPPAPAPAQSGAGPTASYPAESPRRDSGESVSRQAQRRRDALMRRRSSND